MSDTKLYYASVHRTNGEVHKHAQKGKFTLAQLQSFVGGLIQPYKFRVGGKLRDGYVNEEGLLHSLPINAWAIGHGEPRTVFVGDVVVLSRIEL